MKLKRRPVIYFRGSLAEEGEKQAAEEFFEVIEQRSMITSNHSLVIPRYSALPYYQELEWDVEHNGSKLINTFKQHNYVAHIRNWYYDLGDVTPRTWFYLDQIPETGPFVLKGATNSKKFSWKTHMFAKNKKEALEVYLKLSADSMIGVQDICIREFIPLNNYYTAPQDLPISEEYRFFVLDGQVISKAFYWGNYWEEIDPKPKVESVPESFIEKVVKTVSPNIPFFVFDVARTKQGDWILIELNDGQQAGLSMNDPRTFYKNLRAGIDKRKS